MTTMFFETPDAQYNDKRPQFYRDYITDKVRALARGAGRRGNYGASR